MVVQVVVSYKIQHLLYECVSHEVTKQLKSRVTRLVNVQCTLQARMQYTSLYIVDGRSQKKGNGVSPIRTVNEGCTKQSNYGTHQSLYPDYIPGQ